MSRLSWDLAENRCSCMNTEWSLAVDAHDVHFECYQIDGSRKGWRPGVPSIEEIVLPGYHRHGAID